VGRHLDEIAGTNDYPNAAWGFVETTAKGDPRAALDWALAIPEGCEQGGMLWKPPRVPILQKPEVKKPGRGWRKHRFQTLNIFR
jgi:hypothetical protein